MTASPESESRPLAFQAHDHAHCADGILAEADALSQRNGVRLTPVRRRALEILLASHRAMGAYEVLEQLADGGFGNQPPVAYRALEFLVDHGFAHRIRRLNAFAACMCPGTLHRPAFFICRSCAAVAEAPADTVARAMDAAASAIGFAVERMNVEAVGLCPGCQEGADGTD